MNSQLPAGRLADRLESLSREQVWFTVVVATTVIAMADRMAPAIGFAPFYILIICAACWCLGGRAGYIVGAVTAVLTALPHLAQSGEDAPLIVAMKIMVHILTFSFVVATITSFRRSFDRERFLADRDWMTGALNKETFHARAAERLKAARHACQTLLLAMLDLDDFKAVNSRHGHRAGDAVLRAFAQGAAPIIRREDDFGRIGGDEFALLVPVRSAEEGCTFATKLHARLTAVLADTAYPVTCSMGAVVIQPGTAQDEPALMHAVDQLMFAVKHSGKNAVQIGEASLSLRERHSANELAEPVE